MTDHRHLHHPGFNEHTNRHPHIPHESGTSVGGILIAFVLIGLIFLALSLFFSGTSGERVPVPAIDQSTIQPQPQTNSQ